MSTNVCIEFAHRQLPVSVAIRGYENLRCGVDLDRGYAELGRLLLRSEQEHGGHPPSLGLIFKGAVWMSSMRAG